MLERFRTPRWQHRDPQVRRHAVEALTPLEDAKAIAQVACDDAMPAIRRLALRQVLDLALLEERAEQDTDATVREQAARRYRELLAGLVAEGPPLAARLERAARCKDAQLIEYLAREATDDALRAQALARVTRETVLRDVALTDATPELRLEALARIQDEAVLARVQEQSRKTDKRVHHAARERLEAIRESRERPQRVAAESERICEALENLGHDGHWERDAGRLDSLEQRWQSLDVDLRQAFQARFSVALERARAALTTYRAAASASLADREAVIERLEALTDAPKEDEHATLDAWVTARETALREARQAWDASTPLAKADEHDLEKRLHGAEAAVRAAIASEQRRQELERLLAEHQRLTAHKGAIAESDVKALGRAMEELPQAGAPDGALAALERRVDKAHGKLRDRLRLQAGWKKDTLAALPERLDALKTAVTEGRAGDAIAGYDTLTADLEVLLTAGTSTEHLARARKRLAAMAKEVKVMRAWRRFGAKAAHEQLCEQMEALAGVEQPPPAIAEQVRTARAAWKELANRGEAVDQSLWRRFDAAATAAYLPCKAYFAEQANARKTNLARRKTLLEELERFLEATRGGPETDWKGAVRFRRALLKSWHDAHPIPRGAARALAASFDERVATLDGLLGRECERSLRQREQLIAEAEALVGSDDKKTAAEACKRLQRQWSVTVPCPRRQEEALWQRFRGACDAVFSGRQKMFDDERASFKASLEEREALCQRVEALLGCDAQGMDEAERELHRLQGEWSRSAPLPKREAEAVEKRFNNAVRRFAKHRQTLEAQRRREALQCMRARAALCHEAECLPADAAAGAEAITALEARWQALGALPDADDEAALAGRFQQALAAARGDDAAPDADTLVANLAARESICLRLEILAGVDSPPEHASARMALQVERLASALKDRSGAGEETPEALLRAWCRGGPASREHAPGLEARFERAWGKQKESKPLDSKQKESKPLDSS